MSKKDSKILFLDDDGQEIEFNVIEHGVFPEIGHVGAEFLLLDLDFLVVDVEIAVKGVAACGGIFKLLQGNHMGNVRFDYRI